MENKTKILIVWFGADFQLRAHRVIFYFLMMDVPRIILLKIAALTFRTPS